MAWPKGKPRKPIEDETVIEAATTERPIAADRTPTLVELNAQGVKFESERRAFIDKELIAPMLKLITETLGAEAASRGAGSVRSVLYALANQGPLPGQKPKPLRPLPAKVEAA